MREQAARELLRCPACGGGPLDLTAFDRTDLAVQNGVLACPACRSWYRLEERVAELLPAALRDRDRAAAFRERYRFRWSGWDAAGEAPGGSGPTLKRAQIDFYRDRSERYDDGMTDSPFWIAVDRGLLEMVGRERGAGGVLVEPGAGTGRLLPALARLFRTVVAADLSEAMVRRAASRTAHLPADTGAIVHLVADAERLPLRDGAADAVLFSGMLSYLESPAAAIAEAGRILTPGGVVVGQENHRSAFRPSFDFLARLAPPWEGKSWPPQAAIERRDLAGWLASAGCPPRIRTGVFLPPQVVNLLPPSAASRLLRITDALAGRIPWLGDQGGLVTFSGRRDS